MQTGNKRSTEAEVKEMIRLRNEGFSFPRIGRFLGRDHSTVIYWIRKAEKSGVKMEFNGFGKGRKYVPERGVTGEGKELVIPRVYFAKEKPKYIDIINNVKCKHSQGAYLHGRCWICTSSSRSRGIN